MKSLSHVCFFASPWTIPWQAPLSMGFSRQKYWNVLLFPYPGDLPDPVINPGSPALQADSLLSKEPGKPKIYTIDTSYNNHNKYRGFFVAYISILEQCMMESCRIEKWDIIPALLVLYSLIIVLVYHFFLTNLVMGDWYKSLGIIKLI